jgi:hypothetical protein
MSITAGVTHRTRADRRPPLAIIRRQHRKSLQCENRKKDGDRTGSLSTIRTELKFGDMAGMLLGVVPFTDMYEQASASSFLPCLLLREFPCETVECVRQDLKL